jgi:hypothetical protein
LGLIFYLMKKKTEIIALCLLIGSVLIMVYPLRLIGHSDEEEFRYAVMSAVLQGRAVLQGYYPFWTSLFGFGMPAPFFTDLSHHPLFLLIATKTGFAITLIYILHLFIGAYGTWRLCLHLKIKKAIAMVCAVTFLLSSPTINYTFANFWITHLIGWASLPFMTLLAIKLLESTTRRETRIYVLSLAVCTGLTTLSSHPTIIFFDCLFIGLLAPGNWRLFMTHWRALLVTAGMVLVICSGKIFYTFQEYLQFSPDLASPRVSFNLGWNVLWGLFLNPFFIPGTPFSRLAISEDMRSRIISFGVIFTIAAVLAILFWKKVRTTKFSFFLPLFVFIVLYAFRPALLNSFASGPVDFYIPLVLMAIIFAGLGLNWLAGQGHLFEVVAGLACMIQMILLIYSVSPYWNTDLALSKHVTTEDVLINVLRKPDFITNLINLIGKDDRRIILSHDLQTTIDSRDLMTRGLSTNSLPYDNLRLVNGIFKGISYAAFCPDPAKLYGAISAKEQSCNFNNQAFLNIAGVKYALKYTDEKTLDSFKLVSVLGVDRKERPIGLFVNPQVWDDAVFMDEKAGSLYPCAGVGACDGDMFNTDFSGAALLRRANHPPITVVYKPGEISLTLSPEKTDTTVMVDEYYQPDWRAYAQGSYGEKEISTGPILKHFIGLKIPAGTTSVRMVYRPVARIVLEIISMAVLAILIVYLAWVMLEKPPVSGYNSGSGGKSYESEPIRPFN